MYTRQNEVFWLSAFFSLSLPSFQADIAHIILTKLVCRRGL